MMRRLLNLWFPMATDKKINEKMQQICILETKLEKANSKKLYWNWKFDAGSQEGHKIDYLTHCALFFSAFS